jgi:hypothetical protein
MKSSVCLTSMRCFPFGGIQYRDILVAQTFPVKVYFYHFNEPSPYPGPTPGLPYDGQGALFVYQNGNGTRSVISKDYCGEYERSGLPLQMAMVCHGRNMGRLITSCIWGQIERYLCRLCRLSVSGWLDWANENYENLEQFTRVLTSKMQFLLKRIMRQLCNLVNIQVLQCNRSQNVSRGSVWYRGLTT